MTATNPDEQVGDGRYFASFEDVVMAYGHKQVTLHSKIWVRFIGSIEGDGADDQQQLISEIVDESGCRLKVYAFRRVREDQEGNIISQYILTTPGRIIFNQSIYNSLAV